MTHDPIEACTQLLSLYMEDDWDGYGSPRPTEDSVRRAIEFFEDCAFEPEDIGADTLGGVGTSFVFDNVEIVIEFLNNGQTVVVTIIDDNLYHMFINPPPAPLPVL